MCDCGALDCLPCRGQTARHWSEDDGDSTADLIAEIRGRIDDAELAHEQGKDEAALIALREAMALLKDVLEA